MSELDPRLYTVAWIAPLSIEAQAALHMFDSRHHGDFPTGRGDDYLFYAGDVRGHNVILATLPAGQAYGTGSAAALASQVKKFFPNLVSVKLESFFPPWGYLGSQTAPKTPKKALPNSQRRQN